MTASSSSGSTSMCGLLEILIFLAAIVSGTACSVLSKVLMQLHGIGRTDHTERFEKPIFQTLGMFVGMMIGLLLHGLVLFFRWPFPGYDHAAEETTVPGKDSKLDPFYGSMQPSSSSSSSNHQHNNNSGHNSQPNQAPPSNMVLIKNEKRPLLLATLPEKKSSSLPASEKEDEITATKSTTTPLWMYFFLIIPAVFDLGATALCMMGLRYLSVSLYQLLRGSGIIFVALMKQHVLGDRLYRFQWMGVFWNVVSVLLVGLTALLDCAADLAASSSNTITPEGQVAPGQALLGVALVMTGSFVQALQFVFEEKVMTLEDAAVPPLLLIGMEGLWGTLLCLVLVYPLVYYLPGDDHGSYEDPWNTYVMVLSSTHIQVTAAVYFFSIFAYNLFAVLVTFRLSSIWHAILDNFRPITVWCTDLCIYYFLAAAGTTFGEPWTRYSPLQAVGMVVLLYGTAIYNAPNAGSIFLRGQWFIACGIDLSHEYDELEQMAQEAELDREWQARQAAFAHRRASSLAERSPHVSVHTQALRGLGTANL